MTVRKRLIHEALRVYGTQEFSGRRHNRRIVGWLRNVIPGASRDETPWCSAFLYSMALLAGVKVPTRRPAAAISWKGAGAHLASLDLATTGDIVVLFRGDRKSWKRHVGLYIRHTPKYVYLLGGNQANKVQITKYPRSRIDVIVTPESA